MFVPLEKQVLHCAGSAAQTLGSRVAQLEDELLRVERERDILKKALAILSRHVCPRRTTHFPKCISSGCRLRRAGGHGHIEARSDITGAAGLQLDGDPAGAVASLMLPEDVADKGHQFP
ncbi:MAG: hypothetical protein WD872_02140, partial [Pirellulaceae bacterium]